MDSSSLAPLSPPNTSSSSSIPFDTRPSPEQPSMSSTSHPSPERKHSGEKHTGITTNRTLVIEVAAGAGLLTILLMAAIAWSCVSRKKKKRKPHNSMRYYLDDSGNNQERAYYGDEAPATKWGKQLQPPPPPGGGGGENAAATSTGGAYAPPVPPPAPVTAMMIKSTFSYEELAAATGGFAQANLLGQGGFGYVHKGVLPNGKAVAVKQLKTGSRQGEREFQAEVDIISRVHHRHLVSLVGYCISGAHRLLVYEFVPNKTLDNHLHGRNQPTMDWPTRKKIAIGAAKGIAYLHEDCQPRIIHRDIKSPNILLDFKFEAKVADFGLAKLSLDDHTHVSTRVMGTFGYLAPEYASSGKLTEKSDVFSYGVMLLEMITGRRPSESGRSFMDDSLVDWAKPIMARAVADGGNYDELVDPRLENNYNALEMARMVSCCAACVRHSAKRRPRMSQIVRALDGDSSLDDLNDGVRPGQSVLFSSGSDYDSSSYTSSMSRFRMAALNSADFSGEYSGPAPGAGDFVRRPSASSSDGGIFSGEVNMPPHVVNQRQNNNFRTHGHPML